MMFDIVKGLVLCSYIYNEHGEKAKVTPDMLKKTLQTLMVEMAEQFKNELEEDVIIKFKANKDVMNTNGNKVWNSFHLGVANNGLCIEYPGQEVEAIDLKIVYRKKMWELEKKRVHASQLNQENFHVNRTNANRLTLEDIMKVVKECPPDMALKIAAFSCAAYNVNGPLMEMAGREWTKQTDGQKNNLAQLKMFKETTWNHRMQFMGAIPRECWMPGNRNC